MRPLTILLLFGAATACSGPQDDTMDIVHDPCAPLVLAPAADASQEEVQALDDAIALWNTVLDTRMTREPIAGAPVLPIRFEKAAPMFYGIYLDEEGVVVINRSLHDPGERAVVLAHELGHAFGLWHVSGRTSVMNQPNLTVSPNAEDGAAVNGLWGGCAPRTASVE